MYAKKLVLASLITLTPMMAYAVDEIEIHNNTQATTVTAKVGFACSSHFNGGVLHAGETYVLSKTELKSLCLTDSCSVTVFASSSCKDDREFAKVKLDAHDGVLAVNNLKPTRFSIVSSNSYVELDDAPQEDGSGIKGWFNKLFGG